MCQLNGEVRTVFKLDIYLDYIYTRYRGIYLNRTGGVLYFHWADSDCNYTGQLGTILTLEK